MKKLLLASSVFAFTPLLTNCVSGPVSYYPGYKNDYVYKVNYQGYRPYWGARYNASYGLHYGPGDSDNSGYPLNRAGYSYISRW